MEKNFLGTDGRLTSQQNEKSFAIVFNPEKKLAIWAADVVEGNYAEANALMHQLLDMGKEPHFPTREDLKQISQFWKDGVKSGLKALGKKLPKGQFWTADVHDDSTNFTVDIRDGRESFAQHDEIKGILIMIKY